MRLATGYFGIPGSSKGNFTVHVVNEGKPICGWKPSPEHEFQWCSHGITYNYVDCETCKKKCRDLAKILGTKT